MLRADHFKIACLGSSGITAGESDINHELLEKMFGIPEQPAKSSSKAENTSPAVVHVPKPPSEATLAWIRAGGLIGGVDIESDVPPTLGSKEACEQIVNEALAEFDALHPGRRLDEPVELSPSPYNPVRFMIRVDLKIQSAAEGRANLMNIEKDFFEIFQKRGLPYWAPQV